MKIGIITYDRPHRKTQDIMLRLIGKDVIVIAMKFIERKPVKKLYSHRPDMNTNISTIELCRCLGFKYIEHDKPCEIIEHLDVGLIGGCGIIDTLDSNIINSHPAYLPYGRGLDALKWAIYNGQPLGVTTHIINNEVDSGLLIEQEFINVGFYDTFHSVAIRQYEKEIDMIVRAIGKPVKVRIDNRSLEVNRRMPIELEPIMMERFNTLRKKAGHYIRP